MKQEAISKSQRERYKKPQEMIKSKRNGLSMICSKTTANRSSRNCAIRKKSVLLEKNDLVGRLVDGTDASVIVCIYDGDLNNVPSTVSQLNKKPVRYLRAVLNHHGILYVGVKEELIRIGLLKGGKEKAAFSREWKSLLELISMTSDLLEEQEKQDRSCEMFRTRATPAMTQHTCPQEIVAMSLVQWHAKIQKLRKHLRKCIQ